MLCLHCPPVRRKNPKSILNLVKYDGFTFRKDMHSEKDFSSNEIIKSIPSGWAILWMAVEEIIIGIDILNLQIGQQGQWSHSNRWMKTN